MKVKTWESYRPPSRDWLAKTQLSNRQIRKGIDHLANAIGYRIGQEQLSIGKVFEFADETIGRGQMMQNEDLGKLLHLRDLILAKFRDSRKCVRAVRRWDRRMIEGLPKRDG